MRLYLTVLNFKKNSSNKTTFFYLCTGVVRINCICLKIWQRCISENSIENIVAVSVFICELYYMCHSIQLTIILKSMKYVFMHCVSDFERIYLLIFLASAVTVNWTKLELNKYTSEIHWFRGIFQLQHLRTYCLFYQ